MADIDEKPEEKEYSMTLEIVLVGKYLGNCPPDNIRLQRRLDKIPDGTDLETIYSKVTKDKIVKPCKCEQEDD